MSVISEEILHEEKQPASVDCLRGAAIEPDEEEEFSFYIHRDLHLVLDMLVKIGAPEPLIDTIEWCISNNEDYSGGDKFAEAFNSGRLQERYTGDLSLIWLRRDPTLYQ